MIKYKCPICGAKWEKIDGELQPSCICIEKYDTGAPTPWGDWYEDTRIPDPIQCEEEE